MCQLPLDGLLALLAYVAFAAAHYACYGAQRSVGNCTGWSTILLAAAASARASPGGGRCISLSADDLENALIIRDDVNVDGTNQNASTSFPEPTAEQPLLAPEAEEEDVDGSAGPGAGLSGGSGGEGGSGAVILPPAPRVTVMKNSQTQTPAATSSSHEQLVRRRSSEANSFRSAT